MNRILGIKEYPKAITTFLILYGFFVAFINVHLMNNLPPVQTSSFREEHLEYGIEMFDHGGPLLAGRNKIGNYISVGISDDRGIFIYIPLISKYLNIKSPTDCLQLLQRFAVAIVMVCYPIIFYYIFNSVIVAIYVPIFVHEQFIIFSSYTDVYWVQQWIIILCLPIIWFLLKKPWNNISIYIVIFLTLVSSFANSIRSNSSLGIFVLLLLIVIIKSKRQFNVTKFAITILTMVLVYFSISTFTVNVIKEHRNKIIPELAKINDIDHPFWHTMYLGLSFIPNKYGISYDDSIADKKVKSINPNAGFLTKEYDVILKKEYFSIIRNDPKFFIELNVAKAKKILSLVNINTYFQLILLFIVLLVVFKAKENQQIKIYLLSLIPVGCISLIPTFIAIPVQNYLLGFIGVINCMWLLILIHFFKMLFPRKEAVG